MNTPHRHRYLLVAGARVDRYLFFVSEAHFRFQCAIWKERKKEKKKVEKKRKTLGYRRFGVKVSRRSMQSGRKPMARDEPRRNLLHQNQVEVTLELVARTRPGRITSFPHFGCIGTGSYVGTCSTCRSRHAPEKIASGFRK